MGTRQSCFVHTENQRLRHWHSQTHRVTERGWETYQCAANTYTHKHIHMRNSHIPIQTEKYWREGWKEKTHSIIYINIKKKNIHFFIFIMKIKTNPQLCKLLTEKYWREGWKEKTHSIIYINIKKKNIHFFIFIMKIKTNPQLCKLLFKWAWKHQIFYKHCVYDSNILPFYWAVSQRVVP